MSIPGAHHTADGLYRPPALIASIALAQAHTAEDQSNRGGQLYLLAELLAALHRQAEAAEAMNAHWEKALAHISTLPPRPH